MNHDDADDLKRYHITCENRLIYRYKEYRYDNLKDAINFARLDADNSDKSMGEVARRKLAT
ncbi:hypothetical protein R50072_21510 [Simiduia litorea]|uniref:hypothetical protein n=1 Tax=Simiduia litorea TaxID=1435348 RepID=UPI0036F2DEDA